MSIKIKRIALLIIIAAAVTVCAVFIHKNSLRNYQLVDETEYSTILDEVTAEVEAYDSNDSMRQSIEAWLSKNEIPYDSDTAGNIIVSRSPADAATPKTIICTDYNYKTAASSVNAQATLRYIAKFQPDKKPYVLLFLSNKDNEYHGVTHISDKLFPQDSKVIFLSAANKMGISEKSFVTADQVVSIPMETVERTCDTGIKLKIDGLTTDKPDSNINHHPNPLTSLSTIMMRMNGKSMTYEIANINLGNQGNMYPTSLEATILINSYNLDDMTSYLDKRAEKFVNANDDDFPDVSFSYEVIENIDELPPYVYSAATIESFGNFLYTTINGEYKFSEDMDIPLGYEEDDTYAINFIKSLYVEDSELNLTLYSAAINDTYLDTIISDNATAAEFTQSTITIKDRVDSFSGDKSLAISLSELYPKVNGTQNPIPISNPVEFLQCSYLADFGYSLEIVQIYESDKTNIKITNTLMNYIKSGDEE